MAFYYNFMQLTAENLSTLRSGCNSEILLVSEQQIQLVVKAVPMECTKESKHLSNQWSILSKLQHQNIVEVYRFVKDFQLPGKKGKFNLLAQEYAHHGNLLDFIKQRKPNLSNRRFLMREIAEAVEHLHCNSIVHRDIKLDNILIMQNEEGITAKLADFGFATIMAESFSNSFKGTRRGYMAPEIHAVRIDSTKYYDPKAADVFALGVVLFAVVFGRLPFQFSLPEDKIYSLLSSGRSKEFWAVHEPSLRKLELEEHSLMEQFKDLFENMVQIQAQQRFNMQEVLSHPWFAGFRQRPQTL